MYYIYVDDVNSYGIRKEPDDSYLKPFETLELARKALVHELCNCGDSFYKEAERAKMEECEGEEVEL